MTPVLSVEESIVHEHNQRRDSFVTVDGLVQPNLAPRFGRTSVTVESAAIKAGEHATEVLQELQMTEQQINALIDAGVVQ